MAPCSGGFRVAATLLTLELSGHRSNKRGKTLQVHDWSFLAARWSGRGWRLPPLFSMYSAAPRLQGIRHTLRCISERFPSSQCKVSLTDLPIPSPPYWSLGDFLPAYVSQRKTHFDVESRSCTERPRHLLLRILLSSSAPVICQACPLDRCRSNATTPVS